MNGYLEDVLSQPESIREALAFYESEGYAERMLQLRGSSFDKVVFAGMGSSNYCSFGAAIHLNRSGITALTKSAGQLLHYENGLIDRKTLLVLISQSGESGEVTRLLEILPRDANVIAITNDPESSLGRRGNTTFLMHVEAEEAVSSRTYLASWILASMLARALARDLDKGYMQGIGAGIDSLDSLLARHESLGSEIGNFLHSPSYICTLGKGYSYSTVMSGALFTSELAKFPAIGCDSGEFRHGPFEMVEKGFASIVFAPQGAAYGPCCSMAFDIGSHGGKALLVTDAIPDQKSPNVKVIKYEGPGEIFCPLMEIGPLQLFANGLAEARGVAVGKFRWGSKVTTVI